MVDYVHIANVLTDEEGFVPHAYRDHLGYWTIGYGTLVDERKGGGITVDEARLLLNNRLKSKAKEFDRRLSWWRGLSGRWQEALILMAYQMGVSGVLGFKKMLKALEDGNGQKAYDEALDSKWQKQTPERALRVASLFLKRS